MGGIVENKLETTVALRLEQKRKCYRVKGMERKWAHLYFMLVLITQATIIHMGVFSKGLG